jgi:elongation factor Ts
VSETSVEQIRRLREATGAGMMDCKRALEDANGDMDRATEILRERGLASAEERRSRTADQGLIESYIHFNNTVGSLVEVNCETDFVANTDEFRRLAKDIALHVASSASARWLSRDDVPEEIIEGERRIYEAQAREMGKPEKVVPKIVGGKLDAFFEDNVLLEQKFVKDESKTIEEMLDEMSTRVREKVALRRFVRYKLGEDTD